MLSRENFDLPFNPENPEGNQSPFLKSDDDAERMFEILAGKFVLKPGEVLYVDDKSEKEGAHRVVQCESIDVHEEEASVVLRCYFPSSENDGLGWRDDFEIEASVKKGQEVKTFLGPIICFDGECVFWRLMESTDGGRGVLGASIC